MIRSMTGFGKGESKLKDSKVLAELRTVNHKFYELSSRMPAGILFLEDRVRGYINTRIKRGRVNLNLVVEDGRQLEKSLRVNKALAKRYYQVLTDLKKQVGASDNISMDQLVSLPDVITYASADIDTEKIWSQVKAALDAAIEKLIRSREIEGAALHKDLTSRINSIESFTKEIQSEAPGVVKRYKKDLEARIKEIASGVRLDGSRLEAEVAIFAKNCDISEEITRLLAHIKNFKSTLSTDGEAGRQLDFIAQELFREANTIGAKAQDINISRLMIKIKEQIEKIREQVQNVE